MEENPKARPDAAARDPFRRPRGGFDLFGRRKNGAGQPEPPATAPAPPPRAEHEPPPPEPPRQPPPPPPRPGFSQEPRWDDYDLGSPPPRPGAGVPDLSIFFVLLEALRRLVPGDLQGQFNSLLREVLKTLRSMIDWYLERLDRDDSAPEVEDIPID